MKKSYRDTGAVGALLDEYERAVKDLEQLMEHAIVHILRHRRQIERFLLRMV